MKIPKILYHGTSAFRWLSIQRDGVMRCNVRKNEGYQPAGLLFDPNRTSDYLYFTNHIDDAYTAGLRASLTDMRFYRIEKPNKEMEDLVSKYRDLIVLALKTSNIKDRIDIDPEIIGAHQNTQNSENILWYRVNGDIKTKYLIPYRQVDFNTVDKFYLDAMIKVQENTKEAQSIISKNPERAKEIVPSTNLKNLEILKGADTLRAASRSNELNNVLVNHN